jgi:peptidoglycan/LPS O-acetylase OafA/YrhL
LDWVGLGVTGNNINMISFLVLSLLIIKVAYSKPDLSDKVLKGNDISYGVYIYHMLIVNVFVYYGFNSESYLLIAVLLLTYACAILSWFLLEKPVLAFKKNSMRSKL